jgi:hypothetical protein
LKARVLTPEWLDSLPADAPEAIQSRADLCLINRLMGNYRWFERVLLAGSGLNANARIVELGAGDGTLARRLLRSAPGWDYTALDLAPAPPDLPKGCRRLQADLFAALPTLRGDALIANLFLHHFDDDQLKALGPMLREFPLVAFCEPYRHPRFHIAGYALNLLGINAVTRHDLHVSIDAGFAGRELADSLGLPDARVQCSALGAYRLLRRP